MPFGLKNVPATFKMVMDTVLRGIRDEKCLVYVDDVIIFSESRAYYLLICDQFSKDTAH